MTCFSSELAEERGQASVEAAALLPAVSLLVLLLLQPLCCAYSEMVMRQRQRRHALLPVRQTKSVSTSSAAAGLRPSQELQSSLMATGISRLQGQRSRL